MSPSQEIKRLVEAAEFESAYKRLVAELAEAPSSEELLHLSRVLSASVRSACVELACNRATDGSPRALALETLLRDIIKINGEGIYG